MLGRSGLNTRSGLVTRVRQEKRAQRRYGFAHCVVAAAFFNASPTGKGQSQLLWVCVSCLLLGDDNGGDDYGDLYSIQPSLQSQFSALA